MKKKIIAGTILGMMVFSQTAFASSYTVKPGDTLWGISRTSDLTIQEIKEYNDLTSHLIFPGQKLKLNTSVNSPVSSPISVSTNEIGKHTVKLGEYISTIARNYGITTNKLLSLNPQITNPNFVRVGQVINVPKSDTIVQTKPTVKTEIKTVSKTYTIKSGDSLSLVARKHGFTTRQLLLLNPQITNPNIVKVGQVINLSSNQSNQSNVSRGTTLPTKNSTNWEQIADSILASGEKYLGAKYLYGASTSRIDAFDCSSYILRVFKENGYNLPRTSRQQAQIGTQVSLSEIRKGDLLFFDTDYDGVINHVSIYAGNGKILHSATSKGVSYADLKYYWQPRFVKAMRIIK